MGYTELGDQILGNGNIYFEVYGEINNIEFTLHATIKDGRETCDDVEFIGLDTFKASGLSMTEQFCDYEKRLEIAAITMGLTENNLIDMITESFVENYPNKPEECSQTTYKNLDVSPRDLL